MFKTFLGKMFGTSDNRIIKKFQSTVDAIASFEPSLEVLSNEQLRNQTEKLRESLKARKSLDDILPEAFATVREAAKRAIGQRHVDVQMIWYKFGRFAHNVRAHSLSPPPPSQQET